MRFIQELAAKDITITKLYATSVTPTGIAILRNAGFKAIGQMGKRIAFELDTLTADARLARQYRAILRRKADSKTNREPETRKGSSRQRSSGNDKQNTIASHPKIPQGT